MNEVAFVQLINDIKNSLGYIGEIGCKGIDCSEESLEIMRSWGDKKAFSPQSLDAIRADLGLCKRCKLAGGRRNIVFGAGNPHARLVFVGEGPGFDEDKTGQPFVGAAGQLLTKIIHAIQLTRESVYICNIIKCRPPKNRTPLPDEIETCLPFVKHQLSVINPEFIVALGSVAAKTLLDTTVPISQLRGRFHEYNGIKLMPTYHPAYLLRNPDKKRDVWEDMKKLMKVYGSLV